MISLDLVSHLRSSFGITGYVIDEDGSVFVKTFTENGGVAWQFFGSAKEESFVKPLDKQKQQS